MGIFEVLAHEDASTQAAARDTRSVIAVQTRSKARFEKYVSKAATQQERDARIALVSTELDEIVREVGSEYGVEDVDRLRNAATVALGGGHPAGCTCGFCKNKGKLPGMKSDDDGDDDGDSDDKSESGDKDDDGDKDDKKPWESSTKTACSCSAHDGGKCTCGADCKCSTCKKASVREAVQVRQTTASAAPYDWDRVASIHEADGFSFCKCNCDGCNEGNHCESEECIATKHSGNPGNPDSAGSSEKTATEKLAMAVSKRDFEAIAAILKQNGADPAIAQQIADYFASQNERFDNDRFMDASGAGQLEPPLARIVAAAVRIAVDVETGDTFTTERVDLPSSKDGVGGPSPKIDKANSGDNLGWDLKPIDVPSKQHPEERQQIHQTPEYKADLPGVSETGKEIDADSPLQPEHNVADNTDTWTGTEGQANPVTSAVLSKWTILT